MVGMMKGGTTRRMREDDMKKKFHILTSFPDQQESVATTNGANGERIETSSLDSGYWTLDIGYSSPFRMADGRENAVCWSGGTVGPCGPASIWPVDGREGWMPRNRS